MEELKIKDDIDLKEFEKFGFNFRPNYYIKYIKYFKRSSVRIEDDKKTFYIDLNNEGSYNPEYAFTDMIDDYIKELIQDQNDLKKLFIDLIQANLVEKAIC